MTDDISHAKQAIMEYRKGLHMRIKSILIGAAAMLVIATIFYTFGQDDKKTSGQNENQHLLIIEDSILDNLTDAEVRQLQEFAGRALNASEKPTIYSPHAKYLENGAILAYMAFVNHSADAISELHSLTVKMIDRDSKTIASGQFPGKVSNMPVIDPNNVFLFALVFEPGSVRINNADLSSYITETIFDYTTVPQDEPKI